MRGRVVARDGERARVRADGEDRVGPAPADAQPGDLIDGGRVVRRYGGGAATPEFVRLGPERATRLRQRAAIAAAIRRFFDGRGFLEVDTPLVVPSPGMELHLRAVPAGRGDWLITSPEYHMKRLLAGGLEKIYTVCKCFRGEEAGAHHNREFTMLEWYRAWDTLDTIARDTEELVASCAEAIGGAAVDVEPPWERMPVADAMEQWAGVRVRGDEEPEVLRERVIAAGIDVGQARAWDDVFFCAFVDRVDPAIARRARPLLLVDWPAPLAALARRNPDGATAERFEAYVGGLELANAFGELTDAAEQRARFEAEVAARAARGLDVYPIDDKLMAALAEGIPDAGGIALGVDRLAMVLTGARDIREVLAFAADEV